MAAEIIPATPQAVLIIKTDAALPVLVERAGVAARFAWDEFFYAEEPVAQTPH